MLSSTTAVHDKYPSVFIGVVPQKSLREINCLFLFDWNTSDKILNDCNDQCEGHLQYSRVQYKNSTVISTSVSVGLSLHNSLPWPAVSIYSHIHLKLKVPLHNKTTLINDL